MRAVTDSPSINNSAAAMGRRNLLGPALPGFTKRIPFRSSMCGLCECPETTTRIPADDRSMSRSARSWTTWIVTSPTRRDSAQRSSSAHGPRSLFPLTAVTGASASSSERILGSQMSPACTMKWLPRRNSMASGRSSPCVSEISPTLRIKGLPQRGWETWRGLRLPDHLEKYRLGDFTTELTCAIFRMLGAQQILANNRKLNILAHTPAKTRINGRIFGYFFRAR
jgi:hypothetical protein